MYKFNPYAVPQFLGFLSLLIVSCLVFVKNKKSIVNISFSLLFLSAAIWQFGFFMVYLSIEEKTAVYWTKFVYIGVPLLPTTFYHFIISFLNIKKYRKFIYLSYVFSGLFIFLAFRTNYFINGVYKYYWGYYTKAAFLHIPFLFLFMCFWLANVIVVFREYRKAKKEGLSLELNRLKYLLLAFFFVTFASLDYLPCYGIEFYPFGYIFVIILVGILSYAIFKYQLMDINIVIRKTAAYSIVVSIITLIYFILVYLIEFLFRGFMGYKSIPWTLSVIVLFAIIFQPLKDMVQAFIDRHFFKDSRVLLQEELKKTQEELKRAERLKAVGTLAAGMAHEIKNPLTSIKTFTEHLRQKKDDPEFINKFERIVGGEVDKINKIVRQLLDFAKPAPLKLEICNINSLLEDILTLLSNDIFEHKIELSKEYSEIPNIHADINQLKQAFLNILLNAIEAMKEGGKLTVATKSMPSTVEIIISDTGSGISKKDLEHIFDPFYTTKNTGTGLGMSIVYGIIKQHRGDIRVESEEAKGTKVRIELAIK